MKINRRNILQFGASGALASILGPGLMRKAAAAAEESDEPMPRRQLGKTGEMVSVIGFGGMLMVHNGAKRGAELVSNAVDRGVTYFDVAPTYGSNHEAEKKLGPALKPYRDKVFLSCKTKERSREGAQAEIEGSLKRLQTDHFDLYLLHSIKNPKRDVERAMDEGGAMEAILEAQKAGKIRYIGFSSHSVAAAKAALETKKFDVIMHPINFVSHYKNGFDKEPVQMAKEQDMGIMALKSMVYGAWQNGVNWGNRKYKKTWYLPIDEVAVMTLAMRWTLGQGVTSLIPSGQDELFEMAMNIASKDAELTDEEATKLEKIASETKPLF
ncbi:MAG: aldo/keto reductase [Candidatus Sumerlaeia bacterium]